MSMISSLYHSTAKQTVNTRRANKMQRENKIQRVYAKHFISRPRLVKS